MKHHGEGAATKVYEMLKFPRKEEGNSSLSIPVIFEEKTAG